MKKSGNSEWKPRTQRSTVLFIGGRDSWAGSIRSLHCAPFRSFIKIVFKHLKREIEKITAMIMQLIEQDAELKEQFDILKTIPGIGKITAITLLGDCPELRETAVKASAGLRRMQI